MDGIRPGRESRHVGPGHAAGTVKDPPLVGFTQQLRRAGAALWRVELHLASRLACVGAVVAGQAAGRLQVWLKPEAAVFRAPPQVVCSSTMLHAAMTNSMLCRTPHHMTQELACHKVGHVVVQAASQLKSTLDKPLQHSNELINLYSASTIISFGETEQTTVSSSPYSIQR